MNKYLEMSDKDYFAYDALSNSDFRLLRESPLHLVHKELFRLSGASLSLGSAVHTLVLEPKEWDNRYIVAEFKGDDLNKNSTAYKNAFKLFELEAMGLEIITKEDYKKIKLMARNITAIAGNLVNIGVTEKVFISEIDGIKAKCKVDLYIEKAGIVCDVKTTADIDKFQKSMLDYGYITQASYYTDVVKNTGMKATRFIFIVVETKAPYFVKLMEVGTTTLNEGRALYGEYLTIWKDFKEKNILNYPKKIEAPEWWLKNRGVEI